MKEEYDGLTVNERLYVSGLDGLFQKAVKAGDIQKVEDILRELEVDQHSTIETIKCLELK